MNSRKLSRSQLLHSTTHSCCLFNSYIILCAGTVVIITRRKCTFSPIPYMYRELFYFHFIFSSGIFLRATCATMVRECIVFSRCRIQLRIELCKMLFVGGRRILCTSVGLLERHCGRIVYLCLFSLVFVFEFLFSMSLTILLFVCFIHMYMYIFLCCGGVCCFGGIFCSSRTMVATAVFSSLSLSASLFLFLSILFDTQ